MKRRKFLKSLGIGATAAIVAPKLITELVKNKDNLIPGGGRVPSSVIDNYIDFNNYGVLKATMKDGVLTFGKAHQLNTNDTIIIANDNGNEQNYIVTEVFSNNKNGDSAKVVAINFDNYNFKGKVSVCHIGRKYKHTQDAKGNNFYYTPWGLLDDPNLL